MTPRTRNIAIIAAVLIILGVAAYFIYQYIMNQQAANNANNYIPDTDISDQSATPDQGNINMSAFLRLIRKGETGETDDAYTEQFGGGHFSNNFVDHPRQLITLYIPSMGKNVTSDAAGAYQFLSTTWDECAKACGLTDFSPASQDKAAVYLITLRGAYDNVISGNITAAMTQCHNEWASLPGSPYGQPTQLASNALAVYENYGGIQA